MHIVELSRGRLVIRAVVLLAAAAATAAAAAAVAAGTLFWHVLQFEKCQKGVGTFFGHVFAIRKVAKVCNCRQKSSGYVFRARF